MRTLLTLACVAALGGCAIIVTPGDGDFRVYSAFSNGTVVGNGIEARDERAVQGLQRLDVSGSMLVEVRVGPAPSLVVEADSNLLPLIRTEARGDALKIYSDGSWRTNNPIRITYTVPRLTELHKSGSGRMSVVGLEGAPLKVRKSGSGVLELAGQVAAFDAQMSGSGSIEAHNLRAANANIAVSGSGSMRVGEIRGEFANIGVSGSGDLQAAGTVQSLTARVNGSGSAILERLMSEQADLASKGSGSIRASVRQNLVATTGGSGGIRVYGNPAQRTISGKRVYLLD